MSLEQLIEQDIVRFLEGETHEEQSHVAPRLEDAALAYLNKEYEKEVKAALKRNDVEQAKRLFNELKHNYEHTPKEHELVRKHLYSELQACYLDIINALQERLRTNVLLQQMEQSPEDVFNTAVKPINLQTMQQRPRTELPAFEKLTKEMLTPQHKHPLAEQHQIQLPPPPSLPEQYAEPAQAPEQAPPAQNTAAQKKFLAAFKDKASSIIDIGKADLKHAQQLLAALKSQAQEVQLNPAQAQAVQDKLSVLEAALQAYGDKKAMQSICNTLTAEIARYGRLHDPRTLTEYKKLATLVDEFEKKHPVYKGLYTHTLVHLKQQFSIYDEDEIIERVLPILAAIKSAAIQKNVQAVEKATHELQQFTLGLLHTQDRELLERVVARITDKVEHRSQGKLQLLVERIHAAAQTKNITAYSIALDSLAQYASTLNDKERAAVLEMVAHLRANAPVLTHA